MKKRMQEILTFVGYRDTLVFLILSFSVYFLIEKTGLFGAERGHAWDILHSSPARVLGLFVVVHAVANVVLMIVKRETFAVAPVLFYIALVVIVSGLWISFLTRFEGRSIKAEGESFTAFHSEYERQSLHARNRSDMPAVGLTLLSIVPHADATDTKLKSVEAEVIYSGRTTKKIRRGTLSSSWPLYIDRTLIRITDFGYAPIYDLKGIHGNQLEKKGVNMKLYPPGAEDRFEAMFLGYLFYLRLYPDYIDLNGDPASKSPELRNPVYKLRITRNKDIVYNDLIKPTGKLRFDNFVIQIPEVKMWVEISFIRDPGLLVIGAGLLLMVVSVISMYIKRR